MQVDFKAELTKVWTRTTPNGHAITDFTFKIPTTVIVDKQTRETRQDTLDGFIFKDMGEEWLAYKGPVRVVGDLRICRFIKNNVWQVKPEVCIKNIYMTGDKNE